MQSHSTCLQEGCLGLVGRRLLRLTCHQVIWLALHVFVAAVSKRLLSRMQTLADRVTRPRGFTGHLLHVNDTGTTHCKTEKPRHSFVS